MSGLMTPGLSKEVGWESRKVNYPSDMDAVKSASPYQLLVWNRFLPSPKNDHEYSLLTAIVSRLFGGVAGEDQHGGTK